MADITKCHGEGCPIKTECYRFTAKECKAHQSYFVKSPIKKNKCDMFWGENQQDIFNTLKKIMKIKKELKRKKAK